ncbi:hypothetical protein Tco_1285087 [Tanacetum coccineum]
MIEDSRLIMSWDVAAGIGTVWSHLNQYARMRSVGSSMQSIISYLIPLAKRKMTRSVIGKIVVAATAYFVAFDLLRDALSAIFGLSELKEISEMQENDKKQGKKGSKCLILINGGLIQAIPTSLPPQPIGEATKDEAEYVAAARCYANILWMKSQLTNYDIIYEKVPIFCDNTSAIAISNNSVLHSRTKHIDIKYHFIRDHVLKRDIELHFIPIQYQLADIFTKPLDEPTFKRLIIELGMLNIDSKSEASKLPKEN